MIENIDSKDILTFEIEKNAEEEKKIVGTFNKNSTKIELLNPENKYSNLKGTYLNTTKGTFFVDNIEPIQGDIKIRLNCFDLTQKFEGYYDKTKYQFPLSLKEWRNAICTELDVEYDDSDFPNSDYVLQDSPYIDDKAKNKDVIKMIARAGLSWVMFDYNDILKFQWFDDTKSNEIEDWFELKTEDAESEPVNIVVIGRGDVEDNVIYPEIEPDNPKEIRIDDNEILDIDRKSMIIPLYNRAKNFKYTIFSMKTSGRFNAKVGESIEYKDMYLNTHKSYIMSHTLSYSGGDFTRESNWISKFEAVELDETNTNYKFAESIEEKTNRTERLANKLDGMIVDLVEEVGTLNDENSNIIKTINSVQETITSTQETIEVMQKEIVDGRETLKNNLVTIDINGISVSTNISAISTLMTNEKFVIKSGSTNLAFFGYDEESKSTKAEMDNLTVTNYLVEGYHRVEKMNIDGEKRTGFFYIGGNVS